MPSISSAKTEYSIDRFSWDVSLFPFLDCGTTRTTGAASTSYAINQSADILVPVPNLRTGIQGSSGNRDPLVRARTRAILLSKPVGIHAASDSHRSGIMNGCENRGTDRPE